MPRMGKRTLAGLGGITAIALGLGWLLSLATTRVVNWFVMTDELYYERLAISVAQTGSLLPRIHGELIGNVNQLYPVLISFVYGNGNVPESLRDAHLLNAFVIVTAAIPVFLLARLVGLRLVTSLWVGALSVAVPWVVLASFLLTEVVAYPAFCWAVLAVTYAVLRRTDVTDLLAVAAIGFSVLARVQFALLAVVLVFAIVWDGLLVEAGTGARGRALVRSAALRLVRTRRLLVALVALGFVGVLAAALTGDVSRLLGAYSVTASGVRLDLGLLELFLEHVATLALGLAILPFLVGVGWLVERARPSAADPQRAFALVGSLALLLLTAQVASFDQRFGAGLVKDRYLFYVVPIVLVALAAAVDRGPWPRWWALLVPAGLSAIGFATLGLPRYEKLNVDSVLAMLNDELVRLATSEGWARALLVLTVVVSLQLLLVLATSCPVPLASRRRHRGARLPRAARWRRCTLSSGSSGSNGTNGLPVTLDQGIVFNWLDRHVGARRSRADGPVPAVPHGLGGPDRATGGMRSSGTRASVEAFDAPSTWESLLRSAHRRRVWTHRHEQLRARRNDGRTLSPRRGAGRRPTAARTCSSSQRPWRAAWVTDGIHPDGWMRPHTPATISVFAEPGQTRPLERYVTLSLSSPDVDQRWPVKISSNLDRSHPRARPQTRPSTASSRSACRCAAPGDGRDRDSHRRDACTAIPTDDGSRRARLDRPVGLLLGTVALADEHVPVERCPPTGRPVE